MENSLWTRLRTAPKIRWIDLLLTILPAISWLAAVHSRPVFMSLHCMTLPESCTEQKVFLPDRLVIGKASPRADDASFTTQNLAGYAAFIIPPLWNMGLAAAKIVSPWAALTGTGTDLLLTLQAVAWNGIATESARLLVQRPRPFVYSDPKRLGSDPAHYTSFYSGHTSFSAVALASLFFVLIGRAAPRWVLGIVGTGGFTLVFLTGLFRVLSGRHFITDVLFGALAGLLIALVVAFAHRIQGAQQEKTKLN